MNRIDPRLRLLQEQNSKKQVGLTFLGLAEMGGAEGADVLVYFTGSINPLIEKGFKPTTVAGDVAAGFVPFESLDELAALDSVKLIEVSRPLKDELNLSLAEMGVTQFHVGSAPLLGEGVIIGIIDSGIDYTHECFMKGGKTRIISIWDQRLDKKDGGQPPDDYDLGVEYDRDAIQAALDSGDPDNKLRHVPSNHGTHVAGIAAGNGSAVGNGMPQFTYVGIAPEAEIIFVAYKSHGPLSDSNATLNAVEYILREAKKLNRPVVINISQGDNLGSHDGMGMLERAIDNLLKEEGQVVVKSAGNGGGMRTHASGTLADGEVLNLPFVVPEGDEKPDTIELWYAAVDSFDVALRLPVGVMTNVVSPGPCDVTLKLPNGNKATIDSGTGSPLNGDNRILIYLERGSRPQIEPGVWEIVLKGRSVINGRFHAWADDSKSDGYPVFDGPLVSNECNITSPGTAKKVITVGAYITNEMNVKPLGQVAPYSSAGPTRDGRRKPELAAPGEIIMAPHAFAPGEEPYSLMEGTSMAAPHVAGVVALMLQKNRRLTAEAVKAILTKSVRKDDFTGQSPGHKWGFGKINAQAALKAV
jgi:subtilisin family serine protease